MACPGFNRSVAKLLTSTGHASPPPFLALGFNRSVAKLLTSTAACRYEPAGEIDVSIAQSRSFLPQLKGEDLEKFIESSRFQSLSREASYLNTVMLALERAALPAS